MPSLNCDVVAWACFFCSGCIGTALAKLGRVPALFTFTFTFTVPNPITCPEVLLILSYRYVKVKCLIFQITVVEVFLKEKAFFDLVIIDKAEVSKHFIFSEIKGE